MKGPTIHQAIKQMRSLSGDNISFSFSYLTYNSTKNVSDGVKQVKRAKLRVGLSTDKGIKSRSLIGYIDLETNKNRWFYLPLLLTFNQFEIDG